jgi:predicted RecA/RadA family phage recombinase
MTNQTETVEKGFSMAEFKQDGDKWDYTPGSAVAVGAVVVLNDTIAVADRPIAANTLGAVAVEGVFELPKATGAIGQGAVVYWDSTNSNVTTTATGNKRAGKAAKAADSADASAWVAINLG